MSNCCANCGCEVIRKPSFWKRIKGLATCSKYCRAEYLKTAYLGISNPNYKKGEILEKWFNQKEKNIAHRAKQRKLEYNLDAAYLMDMYNNQNGLCYYTGTPMSITSSGFSKHNDADLDVLSVDRIDSSKGYIKGNIVLCCNSVNKMKGSRDPKEIEGIFAYVAAKKSKTCKIKVKKITADAMVPRKNGLGDVGYDLAVSSIKDEGTFLTIGTGISASPEIGWYLEVYARSSLHKKGLMLINSVGIIDNSYTGEIILKLLKISDKVNLEIGDRVAQLIPKQYTVVTLEEVTNLDDTSRGEGGFGSSGVK